MKINISIFFLIVIFSCNNSAKNINEGETNDSLKTIITGKILQPVYEDSIPHDLWIDTLLKVDFIKNSLNYIDSFTNHKHGIAFLIDSTNKKEILYSAGYNGPDHFETYHMLFIYPDTKKIFVYDPVNDVKLSLEDYSKMHSK